jgi:hypothetical protein
MSTKKNLLSLEGPKRLALAFPAYDFACEDFHVRGADLAFAFSAHKHVHELALGCFGKFNHGITSVELFAFNLFQDLVIENDPVEHGRAFNALLLKFLGNLEIKGFIRF